MRKSLFFAFNLMGTIGFATAIPLVIFGLTGRYLDQRLGTGLYLFLISLAIATVIIYFTLKQIIKNAIREFDEINQ